MTALLIRSLEPKPGIAASYYSTAPFQLICGQDDPCLFNLAQQKLFESTSPAPVYPISPAIYDIHIQVSLKSWNLNSQVDQHENSPYSTLVEDRIEALLIENALPLYIFGGKLF
jgi:hypothetical protein